MLKLASKALKPSLAKFTLKSKMNLSYGLINISHKHNHTTSEKASNIPTPNQNYDQSLIQEEKLDLFHQNIQIESSPNTLITYNDIDTSLVSDILKTIDISNVSTIPFFSGRFSRIFCFTEDLIHSMVMYLSNTCGLGIGTSIVLFGLSIRAITSPLNVSNFKNQQLTKTIQLDIQEFEKQINELRRNKQDDLVRIEQRKLKEFKERHKIFTSKFKIIFSFLQIIILVAWAALVQRMSIFIEDYPEFINGGFLWLKDLTVPDPYFILPFINCVCIGINIVLAPSVGSSNMMFKYKKFFILAPIFGLPVLCTFESGFLLYLTSNSFASAIISIALTRKGTRKWLKIPYFFPNTKLANKNPWSSLNCFKLK